MSQFSRFIRPGYYRVENNFLSPTSSLTVTAYKDSAANKTVIVAVNKNSSPLDMDVWLRNGSVNSFATYTTTEFKNVARGDDVSVVDNRFRYNLEASSVTTFVSE